MVKIKFMLRLLFILDCINIQVFRNYKQSIKSLPLTPNLLKYSITNFIFSIAVKLKDNTLPVLIS